MPRRLRVNLSGLPLHIVQRGNNRAACFFADEDYRFYLHWLRLLANPFKPEAQCRGNMTAQRDDLAKVVSEISRLLDEVRRYHAQQAEKYGYALDVFRKLPTVVQHLNLEQRQALAPVYEKFQLFLQAKEQSQDEFDVSSGAFVLGSATASTAIFAFPIPKTEFPQPLNWSPERSQSYANRLERVEPEIGRIYRSVSEAFWGGTENPERTALYQLRQCFDQLFAHLAPDEAVRKSGFFREKPPPNEKMQVYRRERILYAAHTHVKDLARAELLAEQADPLLHVYERLQRAHDRSPLDRDHTRLTIESMIALLEQWVDAIAPSGRLSG